MREKDMTTSTPAPHGTADAATAGTPATQGNRVGGGLLDPKQLFRSLPDALRKLDPRTLWRNPVMLIVEIGAAFTTVLAVSRSE